METVFPALKLKQIFSINMNIFFLKTGSLVMAPPFLYTIQARKTILTISQNMKREIQKPQFLNSLVNWEELGSTA